jgi:hypothetical protein
MIELADVLDHDASGGFAFDPSKRVLVFDGLELSADLAKALQRHGIKLRLQAREKADETWLRLDFGANQESNHVG